MNRPSVYITAGNSFIARNIVEQLDYDFVTTTHDELDLTNIDAVNEFFKDRYFDYVIHTACVGGRRYTPDNEQIYNDNFNMFLNLYSNGYHFDKLINFGSGADQTKPHYGQAKSMIAGFIRHNSNMVNLRLFGVWGKYELPDRFPAYCRSHDEVTINQDKKMRYIHVDDLVKIIDGIIKNWPDTNEMTVGEPILLSKFAKQLNPDIKVVIKGKGEDYA